MNAMDPLRIHQTYLIPCIVGNNIVAKFLTTFSKYINEHWTSKRSPLTFSQHSQTNFLPTWTQIAILSLNFFVLSISSKTAKKNISFLLVRTSIQICATANNFKFLLFSSSLLSEWSLTSCRTLEAFTLTATPQLETKATILCWLLPQTFLPKRKFPMCASRSRISVIRTIAATTKTFWLKRFFPSLSFTCFAKNSTWANPKHCKDCRRKMNAEHCFVSTKLISTNQVHKKLPRSTIKLSESYNA